jgi:hypothetical protein
LIFLSLLSKTWPGSTPGHFFGETDVAKQVVDELKGKPCRIKINKIDVDFSKCVPFTAGAMMALETATGIKLMSGGTETLSGITQVTKFVHFFANLVDERVRLEDVGELPFDVVAWIARWLNSNGVRDISDPNLLKPHTF